MVDRQRVEHDADLVQREAWLARGDQHQLERDLDAAERGPLLVYAAAVDGSRQPDATPPTPT